MNIVQHPIIHEELHKRWKELGLKPSFIAKDAQERGMKIDAPQLSVYKKMIETGRHKGGLTFKQLTWLCIRWHVPININIGTLTIKDGKPVYVIEDYNELKALRKLKLAFPNTK